MARFSDASLAAARAIFSGEDKDHPACPDCGGIHSRACPRVSSEKVMLSAAGEVVEREVHFFPPGTWEDHVIFAEDVWDDAG